MSPIVYTQRRHNPPAAAAGVAGLLSGKIKLGRGARVVAILTGGNIDPDR